MLVYTFLYILYIGYVYLNMNQGSLFHVFIFSFIVKCLSLSTKDNFRTSPLDFKIATVSFFVVVGVL